MSSTQDPVIAEQRGPVLLLTLNRPERMNAWNSDLEQRYFSKLEEAERDPEIRAVVLTGAGRAFCAGADLDDLKAISSNGVPQPSPRMPRAFPLSLRMPMVAAINGAAVGLGLVEALYCDVRFASSSARLSTAFARRGLIAEYGISWILPRLIGQGNASDLLLSGRQVTGQEALAMGLVNRVVEPDLLVDEAVSYAQDLATLSSPTSLAIIKEQIARDQSTTLQEALTAAEALMLESLRSPDVHEGVTSFLEKRPPAFPALSPRP